MSEREEPEELNKTGSSTGCFSSCSTWNSSALAASASSTGIPSTSLVSVPTLAFAPSALEAAAALSLPSRSFFRLSYASLTTSLVTSIPS
jgi:hypothetical protein